MTTARSRTTSSWKMDLYFTVEFHNYPDLFSSWFIICCSASSKDESNSALWLAAWAGKMELSCPFGTTRRVPQETFSRKPYNKSFIDQACSIKMAGYRPSSFLRRVLFYGPRPGQGPETRKKRTRPISSHLDRKSLVNKGFIIWLKGKIFSRDTAGNPDRAR